MLFDMPVVAAQAAYAALVKAASSSVAVRQLVDSISPCGELSQPRPGFFVPAFSSGYSLVIEPFVR